MYPAAGGCVSSRTGPAGQGTTGSQVGGCRAAAAERAVQGLPAQLRTLSCSRKPACQPRHQQAAVRVVCCLRGYVRYARPAQPAGPHLLCRRGAAPLPPSCSRSWPAATSWARCPGRPQPCVLGSCTGESVGGWPGVGDPWLGSTARRAGQSRQATAASAHEAGLGAGCCAVAACRHTPLLPRLLQAPTASGGLT